MMEKSVGVSDEEKLHTDNIILCNILNRQSQIKEYTYNDFERLVDFNGRETAILKVNATFTLYFLCLSS